MKLQGRRCFHFGPHRRRRMRRAAKQDLRRLVIKPKKQKRASQKKKQVQPTSYLNDVLGLMKHLKGL